MRIRKKIEKRCYGYISKNSIFIEISIFRTRISIYLFPLVPTSSLEIPGEKSIAVRVG